MALTKNPPRKVHLAGPITIIGAEEVDAVGKNVCSASSTPGMLAEMHDDSGVNKWRPNASATEIPELAVFLENSLFNKGIDDAYAAGDVPLIGYLRPGSVWNAIIPSGETISNAELLQSNGDGKLKSATATTADAMLGRFKSLENIGAVTVDTRVRVRVIC